MVFLEKSSGFLLFLDKLQLPLFEFHALFESRTRLSVQVDRTFPLAIQRKDLFRGIQLCLHFGELLFEKV